MPIATAELNGRFALPGALAFAEHPLGGPVCRIETGHGSVDVALKGGHVLAWRPAGAAPVLWLSPLSRLDDGLAIRGGVPVCWPWFATHPTDPTAANHGTVRTRPWSVVSTRREPGGRATSVTMASEGIGLAGQPLTVSLTVTLAEALTMTLVTGNRGTEPETLTQALHTYFAVLDIDAVRVEGLAGLSYLDKLDGFARKPQSGDIRFDREVDRIYLGPATARVVDERAGRTITIDSQGTSRSTVVWNPWIEKTARMGDMPPEGYRTMVCVETGNVADDAVTIPAGGSATLTASISVA